MSDPEQQERAALEAVLSSRQFAKCSNLATVLRYVCLKHFEGCASELKEYRIGVEALGRSADFDPTLNSVVRVEIHRLREKLKRYYQTEGRSDSIVISLSPGSYVPQFTRRDAQLEASPEDTVEASENAGPGEALPEGSPLPAAETQASRFRLPGLYGVIALLAAAVIILAAYVHRSFRAVKVFSASGPVAQAPLSRSPTGPQAIRILAGYRKKEYVDRAGQVWQSDRYFSGGEDTASPERFFWRTLDPTLFETSRVGDFAYNIPLTRGNYELRLYFAETIYGPDTTTGGGEASRIFDVTLNGRTILSNFDVTSDAAGEGVADIRVFENVSPAPDGCLHLRFERKTSDPFVNAIEIDPAPNGEMNPIRIVAQNNSFTDHEGRLWLPDCYFRRGRLALRRIAVENTADPGLYAGERYGHFNYAIPVAPARYRLSLQFAETYFGPGNPGGGGPGSRVFDVYCNGTTLLHHFDIFKEAGGANRALEKTFYGIRPGPEGKIILRFVPVTNYACINAVELAEE